jgi:PadR family transcriptional regulator PadR
MRYIIPLPMRLQQKMLYGHAETLVLRVLANGQAHPYRLRQVLAEKSGGHFQLALGRLYPLLAGMEKRGLVRSVLRNGRGTQQRRMYTITARGHAELQRRVEFWEIFLRAMRRVI